MFPIDVLRFSEFRTMSNHLSETLMLNDIQIDSDYMSRWVVLKRRVGAVTSQRVFKVLFYVNILQYFFVVENCTAYAVSVAIGDNGNRLIYWLLGFTGEDFLEITRKKNFLWWPCLLTDRDEMSILSRGPSIDAYYQVVVHLANAVSEGNFF